MKDLTPMLANADTSIAVVGATDRPGKYGGIVYRNLKSQGYPVMAVNPYRSQVDGDPCWHTMGQLPETPDMAVFVIPAKRGLDVLQECADAGVTNIWLQPGASSPELIEALDSGPFDWTADACVMVRARVAAV